MRRHASIAATALAIGLGAGASIAQQSPQAPQPFFVGNRLGLPITPGAGRHVRRRCRRTSRCTARSTSAESCSYDPVRGVIVVPNRGVGQNVQTNNALGLVHQPRRVGAHRALDRHPESRRPARRT